VLFAGLMLTAEGAKLIEFNVRFGDPECQVLMLRLKSDLLAGLQAGCDGELRNFNLRLLDTAAVGVVMAARGYPDNPEKGSVIGGLDAAAGKPDVVVFHAGTQAATGAVTGAAPGASTGGSLVAAGGRVLTICGVGPDVPAARKRAYAGIDALAWPEGFCRRDIAAAT
jgi:phosphoribosylamine--glycine ligase